MLFRSPFYGAPEESKFANDAERAHIRSDAAEPPQPPKPSWFALLGHRQTWGFVLAKGLTDPVWWFFLTWLPDFFKKTRGLDLKGSWLHLVTTYAIATVLSVVGGWFSGYLIQRGWSATRARKTALFVFAILIIPVAFATKAPEWVAVFLVGLAAGNKGAIHTQILTS